MDLGEGAVEIAVVGQRISLLAERAAFWHESKALLVADPHFGKAAAFRASGIPVPAGTSGDAVSRLRSAVDKTGARRVYFLGDLIHAREGRSAGMFAVLAEWRSASPGIEVVLVRGNHDRRAGDPPSELAIECVDSPHAVAPLVLAHHPREDLTGYVIAGHVHPAVRLYGRGRERARLPCFVFGPRVAVLPAFGDFTGYAEEDPAGDAEVYAIADGRVLKV